MKDNKLKFTERKLKSIKENKLIAEFMGHEFTLMPDTDGKCYTEKDSWDVVHEDDFWVDRGCFAYNTSWDWLMPVVEKIEEIAIDDTNLTIKEHRYQFDMGYTQCNIYDHVKDCLVASGDMGSKLLSTHQAVVEFINQYKK